jgi:hypothetical protein
VSQIAQEFQNLQSVFIYRITKASGNSIEADLLPMPTFQMKTDRAIGVKLRSEEDGPDVSEK